jgi:hypothetical protein
VKKVLIAFALLCTGVVNAQLNTKTSTNINETSGEIELICTIFVQGSIIPKLKSDIERSMESELTGVGQALDEERLIALTVEVDQNQYFCYNSITKDFVCQGSDLTEIRERFRARYPDKDAAIYDGDESAVATLKAQLKELKKQNENSIGI